MHFLNKSRLRRWSAFVSVCWALFLLKSFFQNIFQTLKVFLSYSLYVFNFSLLSSLTVGVWVFNRKVWFYSVFKRLIPSLFFVFSNINPSSNQPSSIWCKDLTSWPMKHESPPITTRQQSGTIKIADLKKVISNAWIRTHALSTWVCSNN